MIFSRFTGWWKLEPHDEWLTCAAPHGQDGTHLERTAPPATTYWLLAEPGAQCVAYVRGIDQEVTLQLGPGAAGEYDVREVNPREAEISSLDKRAPTRRKLQST